MKKITIAVILLAIFIGYSYFQKSNTPALVPENTGTSSGSSPAQPTGNSTASYKDGTFTGNVADAYYGPLQVQVTIASGKISDVNFLQYPSDRGQSREISAMSMPQLKQEAIQSQNAHVDIVSGATQTSQAFQQSLQSALDQAKA